MRILRNKSLRGIKIELISFNANQLESIKISSSRTRYSFDLIDVYLARCLFFTLKRLKCMCTDKHDVGDVGTRVASSYQTSITCANRLLGMGMVLDRQTLNTMRYPEARALRNAQRPTLPSPLNSFGALVRITRGKKSNEMSIYI